jgi:hypothetical protein
MPNEIAWLQDDVLTPLQAAHTALLGAEDVGSVERALLHNVSQRWQKVAMVVAKAMSVVGSRLPGVPDAYYSLRVRELVARQVLESRGNLLRMRFSEVRLRNGSET